MYELSILKSFLIPDNYHSYRNFLSLEDFDKELHPLLKAFDEWYTKNTGSPALEDIANITIAQGVPAKDLDYTRSLFATLQNINGVETVKTALERFKTKKVLGDISFAAFEASEGRKSLPEVLSLVDQLQNPTHTTETEFVSDDLEEILAAQVTTPGLRWRLDSLNRSLGSLRKGDFGFVFARPETGKTTFLASEVTHMASQLGEDDGPILWFNNEEQGAKVLLRCYQAALGAEKKHLILAPVRAKEKYFELTHGKLKIIDSASINRRQVDVLVRQYKPSLVIFDQIDKIKGFSADREDIVMGRIYQWGREMVKEFSPVIGTCQADGTAENEEWLYMSHVALAKTAKQAEADFIIGIGKKNDPGYEMIRYINISKNKLAGDSDSEEGLRHGKLQVEIQPTIARYKDL